MEYEMDKKVHKIRRIRSLRFDMYTGEYRAYWIRHLHRYLQFRRGLYRDRGMEML